MLGLLVSNNPLSFVLAEYYFSVALCIVSTLFGIFDRGKSLFVQIMSKIKIVVQFIHN